MKPPTFTSKLLAALVAGGALFTAVPAEAGDDHRGWREHREWRGDHRGRGYWDGHHKHRHHDHYVKERVIVHRRPIVREYHHYYEPHYYEPAPVYRSRSYYPRDPAIVIGVDIPPIVIPLR